MAKEKIFTFDDFNDEMSKVSMLGERMDKSTISEVNEFIHSGNYHLNACLTGSLLKGYPGNRAVALAGPSGTGKTYLLLNGIREAQKMGYHILFFDSENAVDKSLVKKFGIDTTKFRYEPVTTVQEFRTYIINFVEMLIAKQKAGFEVPKFLVCLDSAGNLATQKEIDDAMSGSDKADMTRAKFLKSIFRIIISKLAIIKASFWFTNHVYLTQGFIAQQQAGGGTGPEYAASIILFLNKAQLKEGDAKAGIIVNAKPNKNRFSIPNTIKFHIHFMKGMNAYVGLEQYISWKACGIDKGKIIDDKEFSSLLKKIEREKNDDKRNKLIEVKNTIESTKYEFEREIESVETGKLIKQKEFLYFVDPETAKEVGIGGAAKVIAVKHLGDSIEPHRLFTSSVFTNTVLMQLDEVLKSKFQYSDYDENEREVDDIDTILNHEDEKDFELTLN